ncbi:helical backbone metal receptor [Pulveribacter sp.]|uniref:ABC transporter substrate-binding protein n=1 Tax=Pulveribacter sp. TaxID=2678893 RepID=UPI0028ADCD0A|nr:helical backbone metal receptor [Pulveribacter sp.]
MSRRSSWVLGAAAAASSMWSTAAPGAAPAPAIVALQPSLTEAVCVLGACERLLGIDRYSDWPERVRALPRVGGLADADVEAIVALRPDLVLLGPRSRAAERLQSLGLQVLVLEAKSHADIRANLEIVARAVGRPGAGEAQWQRIDARLQALRAQLPPAWRGRRVYLELHGGKAAASEESFIGETLARLGLANVVPARLGPFPKVSPEFVLRADPDVLIVAATSPAPATRPGWHAMRAVREQRVCVLPAAQLDVLLRAGPRIDEAAQQILHCLQALPSP